MKKLLVLALLILPTVVRADDDAAKAFATGFANALNVQMGGRPYYAPQQVQVQEVYQAPAPVVHEAHWDAISVGNQRGNYYFFNEGECQRFLRRAAGSYATCREVY